MERGDVLIVGGGPAGSSCAWKLRSAGLRVLLIDKSEFPRNKPCAGWITPQIVESLELDVADFQLGRVWQPITGFRCGMIGGRAVETRYERPISYGIRRCEFDAYLLQRAGAECRLGESVRSLERVAGEWVVNGNFRAPLLVGAGGNFCPVARHLAARSPAPAARVVAQEVEFIPAAGQDIGRAQAEMPELYFCRDLLGYGWCFRKGEYFNIGLGRTDPGRLSEHVADFCAYLRAAGRVVCEIPERMVGHAYQLYLPPVSRMYAEGVLLIGDAAGLAYPQSGEGIRPAVESGIIAATVIQECAGDYGAERLAAYQQRLQARLGPAERRGPPAWLPAAWLQFVAARLLATNWFARRVVLDQWFLHRQQTAL